MNKYLIGLAYRLTILLSTVTIIVLWLFTIITQFWLLYWILSGRNALSDITKIAKLADFIDDKRTYV